MSYGLIYQIDKSLGESMQMYFTYLGVRSVKVDSCSEGADIVRSIGFPDFVLIEAPFSDTECVKLLNDIKSSVDGNVIILMTAWTKVDRILEECKVDYVLYKPFAPEQVDNIMREIKLI